MTSTTFAVGVGVDHGPHPPGAHHQNNSASTAGTSNSTSTALSNPNPTKLFRSNNSTFDAHRQNHNSSKLPAFRFADLKKDAFVLPSLLQHIPPSPVSPHPDTQPEQPTDGCQQQHQTQQQQSQLQQHEAHDQPTGEQQIPEPLPDSLHSHASSRNPLEKSPSPETPQLKSPLPPQASSPRARASTFQTSTPAATITTATATTPTTTQPDPSTGTKRPASFPDAPTVVAQSYATRNKSSSTTAPAVKRRLTASGITTRTENSNSQTGDDQNPTRDWAQGQRELLLPKTIDSAKSEDRRKSRPPVSYRPPIVAGARAVIPPIRSFRSSGSRKSLVLDMHVRRASEESYGEDITDPNQRDRTLRALEGRHDDDFSQITPPDSADAMGDRDNTADLFMRIAHEDQGPEEGAKSGEQNAITRIARTSHRRPLSAAVATYQATSPPQITRRLSDQRDSIRTRQLADPQSPQQMTRELAYRTNVREKAASVAPTSEDSGRSQTIRTPLRPSPITPRTISFQDGTSETGPAYRRRQSVTESNSGFTVGRTPQFRNANLAYAQSRTYHSSPLVPKPVDSQKNEVQASSEANNGVEGTESSGSTAAPSTVWDELDDLKSRIHRLELTGKVPSTSGAAMSRASDDRPPTATTNATSMSASPKRGSAPGATQPDAGSTTSSHREPQPLLLSALSKMKGLVSTEVFEAVEAAATDALSLQLMMGAPGQPGPISSGASTIGVGGGMTDRQLRRKADSICRSLTELCIALADEPTTKPPQPAVTPRREKETELLLSPTTTKFAPLASQRRPSALTDSPAPKLAMSPRAPTSLEQRRISLLTSTALPSPRYAAAPATPLEPTSAGRKTSLLVTRNRRAGTEEPEETAGRRSSLLLRTRRAGTEEPEEQPQGRKTSLLFRTRKATNSDEDEPRFRVPSRAVTEVNSFRTTQRDLPAQNQASLTDTSLGSSALPRRRLVPSSLNPRLVAPSGAAPAAAAATPTTPNRRFLDRPAPEREVSSVAEKFAEERSQRQISLSSTSLLNRSGSINRRTRDSAIPNAVAQNTAAGSYR